MILALSTPDTWLLSAVLLLTLLAIGYLAVRWEQHNRTRTQPPPSSPGKRPKRPKAAPLPQPAPTVKGPAPQWGTGSLAERRDWVRERVVHWWVEANRAHNASIDDVPTVTFSPRLKHALGWADSSRNLIKISDHHLMDKTAAVADETVAHEVAHIFADRHYGKPCRHGKLWKKTMIAMGQRPDVTFKDTPADGPEEDQSSQSPPTSASSPAPASASKAVAVS